MAKEGYIKIHSYMTNTLGLSGNTLTVFAFISSFTESGGGFNGSLQYIADWLNISRRSVEKCIKFLKELGLVKYTDEKYVAKSYAVIATERIEQQARQAPEKADGKNECEQNSQTNKIRKVAKNIREKCEQNSDNNNRNNNIITTTPPPHSASRERLNNKEPKYKLNKIGYSSCVKMTEEQYFALLNLVDEETLDEYIFRMDRLLELPAKNHTAYVHSPYHTIKKWIEEDNSL